MAEDALIGISAITSGWGSRYEGGAFKKRWFVLLSNDQLRLFPDKMAMRELGHLRLDSQTVYFISNSRQQFSALPQKARH
jgi:hypothetical protein